MDYQSLVDKVCQFSTQPLLFQTLVEYASKDGSTSRKLVITLARSGMVPLSTSDLYKRTEPLLTHLSDLYNKTSRQEDRRYGDIDHNELLSSHLEDLLSDPLTRGLLIHLSMIAPVDKHDEEEIIYNAFMKELLVAIGGRKPQELNLSSILGRGTYDTPIHHSIPANSMGAFYVRNAIDQWKIKMAQTHHTERLSTKLLPPWAGEELVVLDRYGMVQDNNYSAFDALRLRLQTGLRPLETPMEMKCRWYTNGVVPRVYFVGGTETQDHSGFLYHAFNSLVDSLPNSNRFGRVDIGRVNTFGASEVLYYDLTAFTSNLGEQVYFLKELADYCDDTMVTLLDIADGPYDVCLGDLIRDYVDHTTDGPSFKVSLFPDNSEEYQSSAGCLGVIGNIATCNFLHALVQLQLVESETRAGCAGDDGILAFTEGYSSEKAIACLQALGILVEDKTYRMRHDGDQAVYLKRGVKTNDIRGFSLELNEYMESPSLLPMLDRKFIRRFRESSYSKDGLIELTISSLTASFKSALKSSFTPDQSKRAYSFLEWVYDYLGLPEVGYSPPTDRVKMFLPALSTFNKGDFIKDTLLLNFKGIARVKLNAEFPCDPYDVDLRVLSRVWLRLSPAVAVLSKLGVMRLIPEGSIGTVTNYEEWVEYVEGGLAKVGHQVRQFCEEGLAVWFLYEIDDVYGLLWNIDPTLCQHTGYSGDNASDAYLANLHRPEEFFEDSGVTSSVDSCLDSHDSFSDRNYAASSPVFSPTHQRGSSGVLRVDGWIM